MAQYPHFLANRWKSAKSGHFEGREAGKYHINLFCSGLLPTPFIIFPPSLFHLKLFLVITHSQRASPLAQSVNNLPAMQETQEIQVQSLVREDPLEEDMATHSSILARKIPRTEEPGRLQS